MTTTTKTHRRGAGEGSVSQQKDGLWCARFELGTGADGKRRRKVIRAKTKAEAMRRMKAAKDLAETGIVSEENLTTGQWLDRWLTSLKVTGKLRPTSIKRYESAVRLWIKPYVGQVKLAQLNASHVEQMMVKLEERGLSAQTRSSALTALRAALRQAGKRSLVGRNVASLVDPPATSRVMRRAMSVEQAAKMVDATRGTVLGPFTALGLYLGLRPGEILALKWVDVDFDANTLSVNGTVVRVDGGTRIHAPKTDRSRRTLPLRQALATELRHHKRQQLEWRIAKGADWVDTGHVVTDDDGSVLPLRKAWGLFTTLTQRTLSERFTCHEMRHTTASLLLARGVPLRSISDVLGHTTIGITSTIYGHLAMSEHGSALDGLGDAITQVSEGARLSAR